MQMTPPLWQKVKEEVKSLLMKVKEESEKLGLLLLSRFSRVRLTETEEIKKRWQEYTELYKKELHDPDNNNKILLPHNFSQSSPTQFVVKSTGFHHMFFDSLC